MQTIHLSPQLPPLLRQQPFNNHSEQLRSPTAASIYNLHSTMLPQLVYTSNYNQPIFDTFVTHNPAHPQIAYEMRSYKSDHMSPAQPPLSHSQEQLLFTQPIGHLINPMHSFLQHFADVLHSNQSLPTYSTTIATAVPYCAIDPSDQLIANNANYSIPPLIPQPTMIGPPIPPHPSTLYMKEFPRQQISQTNFDRRQPTLCSSALAHQQCQSVIPSSQHDPSKLLIYRPTTAPQHK